MCTALCFSFVKLLVTYNASLVQENSANAELLRSGLMGWAGPKGGSKRKAQAAVGRETQARKRHEHQVETCTCIVTVDTIQQ